MSRYRLHMSVSVIDCGCFWLLVVTFGCFLLLLLHALAWDYLKRGKEQQRAEKSSKEHRIVVKSNIKRQKAA